MRNPARAAAKSDPAQNWRFTRFAGPPAQERKRPRRDPGANFELNYSKPEDNQVADLAQRACSAALRRAGQLEHRAGLLAEVGPSDAALRLVELAGDLRAVLA